PARRRCARGQGRAGAAGRGGRPRRARPDPARGAGAGRGRVDRARRAARVRRPAYRELSPRRPAAVPRVRPAGPDRPPDFGVQSAARSMARSPGAAVRPVRQAGPVAAPRPALVAARVARGLAGAACAKPRHDKLRWAIGVATFDATALGLAHARTPDPFVDAIRPGRLVIPTYDGSNQATHPDALLERDATGTAHLTLVMTPYPFSNDKLENPSLLASDDRMTFT